MAIRFRSLVILYIAALITATALPSFAFAQATEPQEKTYSLFKSSGVVRPEGEIAPDHFQIRSSLHLGLNGMQQVTDFVVIDEKGFSYDTYSLLKNNKSTRKMLNITEDQFLEMHDIATERRARLKKELPNIIAGNMQKEDLKAKFLEFEAEINETLSSEQLDMLHTARLLSGIQRLGFAEFVGSDLIKNELGLADEDIATIKKEMELQKKQIKARKKDLLIEANKALLKKLTAEQREIVQQAIGADGIKAFVSTNMFMANASKSAPAPKKSWPLRFASLKSIQEKLKLTDAQIDNVETLRDELETGEESYRFVKDQLRNTLDSSQMKTFNQYLLKKHLQRFGTVTTVSSGFISALLDIEGSEADELYEQGIAIRDDFTNQLLATKLESYQAAMATINSDARTKLMETLSRKIDR